jgi:hypothetical protein
MGGKIKNHFGRIVLNKEYFDLKAVECGGQQIFRRVP